MPKYPKSFRLPDYSPYSLDVSMGVQRTPFENGYTRQRRRYTNMPTLFNLRFVIKLTDLSRWQSWWNDNAYVWFDLPLASMYNGTALCLDHSVRCISDLQLQSLGQGKFFEVTCQVELNPDHVSLPLPPHIGADDWIIGQGPPNPAADVYVGGTPAAPATDIVNAGDPANPSSLV